MLDAALGVDAVLAAGLAAVLAAELAAGLAAGVVPVSLAPAESVLLDPEALAGALAPLLRKSVTYQPDPLS